MKYTIEHVENGYMITGQHPNLPKDTIWVFDHDEDDDDADALAEALRQVVEIYRPITKHNAKNVHVNVVERIDDGYL
jgi:hypothetical protein